MDPTSNRGAQLLRQFFAGRGSQSALAGRVRLKQYQLSKFATGARIPGSIDRAKLEDELGIHWRAWDEPAAEEAAEPAPTFRGPNQAAAAGEVR